MQGQILHKTAFNQLWTKIGLQAGGNSAFKVRSSFINASTRPLFVQQTSWNNSTIIDYFRKKAPQEYLQPDKSKPRNPSGGAGGVGAALLWVTNNLSIKDNDALINTVNDVNTTSMLPVYIFDKHDYQPNNKGIIQTIGPSQFRFIQESVQSLRTELQKLGSDLIIRTGKTSEILQQLTQKFKIKNVHTQEPTTRQEVEQFKKVKATVEQLGAKFQTHNSQNLYAQKDLSFNLENLPQSFGEFQNSVQYNKVDAPQDAPKKLPNLPAGQFDHGKLPSLQQLGLKAPPSRGPIFQNSSTNLKGGEAQAKTHLDNFIAQVKQFASPHTHIHTYIHSMGQLSDEFIRKVMPYVNVGCVSARACFHEIVKQTGEVQPGNQLDMQGISVLVRSEYSTLQELKQAGYFQRTGQVATYA